MEPFFESFPLWVNLLFFAAGVGAVIKGADWFTDGSVGIADATGIPKIFIGATIVSLATTTPEISVSWIAAYLRHPETSVGNAVGSIICNIGLILAIASAIQGVRIPRTTVRIHGFSMLTAGVVLVFLSWDGKLERLDGFFLLVGTALYLWIMVRQSGWDGGGYGCENESHDWKRIARHFTFGGLCVVGGSVLIVQNATIFARAAGVSELLIGLTLVALGTSLPELITAITSSIRGHGDIAVGNVVGANVLNVTLVLGGAAFIVPLNIERQMFSLDFPVMLSLMGLLLLLAVFRGKVGRTGGLIFVSIYSAYLIFLVSFYS